MNEHNVWFLANQVQLKVASDIKTGFDIGFDEKIPVKTREKLKDFVVWVEKNFNMPITLWVDFEYKHYLIDRRKKRVGYLFYWSDFSSYPVFDSKEDIPTIRLPVREEYYSFEEILFSFIQAITDYFAWLLNKIDEDCIPNENDVEEILQMYLKTVK